MRIQLGKRTSRFIPVLGTLLILIVFSMGCAKHTSIIGTWKFVSAAPKESGEKVSPGGIAGTLWMNVMAQGSKMEFNDDGIFTTVSKDGSIKAQGSYQMQGDSLLVMQSKSGEKQNLIIGKLTKTELKLEANSSRDEIVFERE